jgi:hypothetical protein
MRTGLAVAAILLFAVAVAHSYLGERYILIRLLRRDNLPHLFGSDQFTKRTLRFAWHITSIAWVGFAAILALLAQSAPPPSQLVLAATGVTFLVTALVIAAASRGKHLAWPVFLLVAVLTWLAR